MKVYVFNVHWNSSVVIECKFWNRLPIVDILKKNWLFGLVNALT